MTRRLGLERVCLHDDRRKRPNAKFRVLLEAAKMAGEAEKTLESLGWKLPEVGKPLGSYVNSVRAGNLLFLSGKFPKENGKLKFVGKVGREVTEEQAQE